MSKSSYWCFTLNNPTTTQCQMDENDFQLMDNLQYICFQEEIGTNNNHHLQGYLELDKRVLFSTIKAWCTDNGFGQPHLELRKAKTSGQARLYCCGDECPIGFEYSVGKFKDGSILSGTFREWGEISVSRQGERNDLSLAVAALEAGASHWELMQNHGSVMARHPQYMQQYRFIRDQNRLLATIESFVPITEWQQNLYAHMSTAPLDRKIHWIWSSHGNVGKSTFANTFRFTDEKESITLACGRHDDIRYVISQTPSLINLGAIFFDFTRSQQEQIPYTVLEQIKNRKFISNKYQSTMVILPKVHLICFSNSPPNLEAMSQDRWDIREINRYNNFQ
nr:MAG: replication associated protein [Cressdnaviricota sp.]